MSITNSELSRQIARHYRMYDLETLSWDTDTPFWVILNKEVGDHFDNDLAEAARLDAQEFSIHNLVLQTREDGRVLDVDPIIGMLIEFET